MNILLLIEQLQNLQKQGVEQVLVEVNSHDHNRDYTDLYPIEEIKEVEYENTKAVVLKW